MRSSGGASLVHALKFHKWDTHTFMPTAHKGVNRSAIKYAVQFNIEFMK